MYYLHCNLPKSEVFSGMGQTIVKPRAPSFLYNSLCVTIHNEFHVVLNEFLP